MRQSYNRQTRRAAQCHRTRNPHEPGPLEPSHGLAISPRRFALTAHGGDLVRVAANLADELALSAEALDLLSAPSSARAERLTSP